MLWFGLRDKVEKLYDTVYRRLEIQDRHNRSSIEYFNRQIMQEITLLHEYLGVEKLQESERLVKKGGEG